jgi:signal peptidase I
MLNDESRLGPAPVQAEAQAEVEAQPATKPTAGRAVREIVETLLLAALIFFIVRLVVLNFRVDGESMTPNLQNDEMLLVNVNSYRHFDLNGLTDWLPGEDGATPNEVWPFGQPERGDIVVFNPTPDAEQPYIKRVIGLPGDRVTFAEGYVYINGIRLEEEYIPSGETRCRERRQQCDVVVSPGHVYVLGDNRTNSTDSRYIGEVPVDQIIGKAWISYWPLNLFGFVPHYDYPELPAPTDNTAGTPNPAGTTLAPATATP